MADETQTPPVEKVYDIEKGWVDKPAELTATNPNFIPHKEIVIPTTPAEAAKIEAPPVVVTPVTFDYKAKYEKYGIENEEGMYRTLDSLDALKQERDTLTQQLGQAPKFESETHQKLHEFLKPYPESSWQEMLKTGAEIVGMDPDQADGMKLLKEAFVLNHPMITRTQAEFLFNEQEAKKYSLSKKKEEYEDTIQYDRDKQLIDIQTQIEVDKSRKIVKEAKLKLMVQPKEAPAVRQVSTETITQHLREIDKVLDGTTKGSGTTYLDKDFIRVKAEEGGEPVLNIQLPAEKLKEIRDVAAEHLKNPGLYDNSGKLTNFDPAKDTLKLAFALFPDWIAQQMAKQVDTLASQKKAEQIAQVQPDKIETLKGKDVKTMTIDDQARELAAKEVAERQAKGLRR